MRNNSIATRMEFEQAALEFAKVFNTSVDMVKKTFKLTQSYLRLEQPITATSTQINFPILNNVQTGGGVQFNTEVRLNQQDSFLPSSIGIYVALPSGATDSAFKIYSYLNPFIFSNAAAMVALYNGSLKLTVNNVVYTPKWDLWKHWDSNQTQQTAAAASGFPVDEFHGSIDGKVPMQPYVALIGSKNNELVLNLPNAPSAVNANSRIIVWFEGFLAQNSTVVV